MHVPKTAGNSVVWVLTTGLPGLTIAPSPAFGVWTHRAERIGGYDLYSGHFDFDFLEAVAPAFRLTVLRHPVARMVSLYDYWRGFGDEHIAAISRSVPDNGPRFAASVGFADFIRSPTPFVRSHVENGLTRQLLGRRYDALAADGGAMIALASRRLASFDWIGVTERFDASLQALAELLDLDIPVPMPRLNGSYAASPQGPARRPIRPTQPGRAETKLILEKNFGDLALYEAFATSGFGRGCKPTPFSVRSLPASQENG